MNKEWPKIGLDISRLIENGTSQKKIYLNIVDDKTQLSLKSSNIIH